MPISFGQSLGALIKTAASGLIQTIMPKQKDEPSVQKRVSESPSEEHFQSNSYFTDSVHVQLPHQISESTAQHREWESLSDRGGTFTETEQAPTQTEFTFQNQTPQVQRMLQSWLQLDPKAIEGLKNFIEVEFQHTPENAEMFLKFQVMRMLKDARQLIEQNELAGSTKENIDSEAEARRAMFGASALGYAYFKKLRRRGKVSSRPSVLQSKLTPEEQEAVFEKGLQAAAHYLKEAQRELRKALDESEDPSQLQTLLDQINDTHKSVEFLLTRKTLMKKIPA